MATKRLAIAPEVGQVVPYDLTEQQVGELRARYENLAFDTPAGYEEGRKAIAHVRSLRTAVEARRQELKAEHLERGRRIDSAAKALTALLVAIETPLKEKKDAIDNAKEVARRAAEEAERVAIEEKRRAERQAEEARLRAEAERLAAERAVFEEARRKNEQERIEREAAERAERERVAAEQRAESDRIAAERAALEAQQRALRDREEAATRVERERQEAIRAEEEARAQAERDRIAAEEARAAEQLRLTEAAARAEALLPDIEKVQAFGGAIRELASRAPAVSSDDARAAVAWLVRALERVAKAADTFEGRAD